MMQANVPQINTFGRIIPMIYAYNTVGVANNEGWTKIGYTERQSVQQRINQQTHTAGIEWALAWSDNAMYKDGSGEYFNDHDFHNYLEVKKQVERRPKTEWFRINGDDSQKMFMTFARGKSEAKDTGSEYSLREEQEQAVTMTKVYFENGGTDFLWNAKPRFGKTLAAYDLVRRMGLKKVLIVTNRPSIANSWADDFQKFIGWRGELAFVSETDALKDHAGVMSREDYLKTHIFGSKEDIISFPVQGTVGEEIRFEYTASDDSGEVFVKVTVNDEEIDADENCAIFVPSETGRYDIVITASDAAGNIRTASGSVVVTSAVINDDTLPTMSITGINQIITLGETLIISITAEDDSGNVTVTASINDSPVEIADGKLEFTPSETGIYTLVIRAEDAAENYVQKLVEILVKEPAEHADGKPIVNIYINDGSGVSAVGEALDIRVTADDPDGISSIKVTVNGEEKELDEEGKLSFTPEETGRFVVVVDAIDSLGNAITETVKHMVVDPEDNSYCEVKITSPSDGGVVTSLTDIKGTVSGDGLVYYALSYCPVGEEEYIEFASGEEPVSNGILGKFDPTLLENGYYNIRLTAYSSLYNVSD